jgi:hypothetical protein
VPEQAPFDAVGDYIWQPANYVTNTVYAFAARGAVAGNGGTIQLWGELCGVRVNIGTATPVTYAAPVIWPDTFYADGRVGLTLSALTGAVVVETSP